MLEKMGEDAFVEALSERTYIDFWTWSMYCFTAQTASYKMLKSEKEHGQVEGIGCECRGWETPV